ncbi:MAG: LysR family transcriptional regulator [Planctomycetes bacterium]|nr:LysR family transcriptional regulator [Planctomycetota bacterium]MCB9919181.1 LysR family transcriptional regulator [Planctomycetota bacterium]
MEIHELEVLTVVIETGGFGKAAKRLALTQSAVSQTIARMERRVGTALLVRSSPPQPTPAGQRVLDFAHGLFDEMQHLERDLADIQGPSTGRIRLGASQMVTELHLERLTTRFAKKHPRVSFDLATVPSRELVILVRDERVELGFGPFQQQMREFECVPFYQQHMRLVSGKRHAAFDGLRAGDASALKRAVLITSYLDPVENRPNRHRLRYRFAGVWQIANLDLRVRLIARGLGVGYLPEQWLRKHDRRKDLAALTRFEHGDIVRDVGLYHHAARPLTPLARMFVEFCREEFSKQRR